MSLLFMYVLLVFISTKNIKAVLKPHIKFIFMLLHTNLFLLSSIQQSTSF